ncbi:F-box/FBD/LRR-repeat protein At1g13570-like [Solanum pennellii]|uniref:F-box/FBD/LRR-repeat protein At1g13570-like n=1 Tax=Solanum pennellii TaxID=28526 RepID=A0ABM1UVV9_SOLPN|nr:F-box/FBD/LRR-repeat protein At1g13570-like [Solanum pennellii]
MFEFARRVRQKLQKRGEELIGGVEKWGFKVRLYNRTPSIDILSECLIHKILCFLSFEEATRMSILSKTWLQAWSNLPNLDFTIDYLKDNDMKIVDDIMKRYWDGKIPIEKFELSVETFFENSHEVLLVPMIDKWLGVVLRNGVKHLTISSYPLFIFSILAVNSVRKLVLEYCTLLPSVVVVNCNSLRKLSLSYLTLDENMLQTLLNSCPLIESFTFVSSWGLETMNTQKIKSVSLKFLKIQHCGGIWEIDAPNLVSLKYTWEDIPQIKIVSESSQLKYSRIVFECLESDNVNAAWFCKLRKFLTNSISWSEFWISSHRCNNINIQNLQLDHKDSNPRVDVLYVNIIGKDENSPTFVDALVWSCQPRILNLNSTREKITFFFDHLMNMKNSSHSTSQLSQIKEVKAYKFDPRYYKKESWRPVEHKSGELAITNTEKWETCYFLLDW